MLFEARIGFKIAEEKIIQDANDWTKLRDEINRVLFCRLYEIYETFSSFFDETLSTNTFW